VDINHSETLTLHSPLPAGQSGVIVCTYNGSFVVVSQEIKKHRIPLSKVRVTLVCEIYFLGPDLVVVTTAGSLIALRSHSYQFYADPRIVSSTDRITALGNHQHHVVSIG
jgi:hypothetical protein